MPFWMNTRRFTSPAPEVTEEFGAKQGGSGPRAAHWLAAADSRRRSRGDGGAARVRCHGRRLGNKQRARWDGFFAALPGWSPGAPLPKPVAYIVDNAFKDWPALSEIMIERKQMPLNPAASRALHDLVQGIVGAELARRLEMTPGHVCRAARL